MDGPARSGRAARQLEGGVHLFANYQATPQSPCKKNNHVLVSVADPDPCDLGPSGSGSGFISQRYAFYHKAKIVRKTLISTVL